MICKRCFNQCLDHQSEFVIDDQLETQQFQPQRAILRRARVRKTTEEEKSSSHHSRWRSIHTHPPIGGRTRYKAHHLRHFSHRVFLKHHNDIQLPVIDQFWLDFIWWCRSCSANGSLWGSSGHFPVDGATSAEIFANHTPAAAPHGWIHPPASGHLS